jgi:hypothetical protein
MLRQIRNLLYIVSARSEFSISKYFSFKNNYFLLFKLVVIDLDKILFHQTCREFVEIERI